MTEKPIKKSRGKNIRVSDEAFEKIRKHCFINHQYMGQFVEETAIAAIKQSKKKV